ncbi:CDGSH iron-sulfur domain-containing protein [Streptomyces sp. NPDC048392]|uniref:CDGSH iron-sulfur domain-containing protein n=1 Tax=Streptomyces sp. NPDC048392 TaxID=3365543 RepID=UPI0037247E15
MPNSPSETPRPTIPPRRVKVQRRGPLLVEGPVEVELEDGTTVSSDRFRVALCTCRRSRRYPWCDTSHRARTPPGGDGPPAKD